MESIKLIEYKKKKKKKKTFFIFKKLIFKNDYFDYYS